jgi:hypothetical protein
VISSEEEKVEALRIQWRKLWRERMDDTIRAEGIAVNDYNDLFVERGTVIHATRNFKALSFKEIVEKHKIADVDKLVSPDPSIGGWTKFIKTSITKRRKRKARFTQFCEQNKQKQQLKKCGRGWLHI